MYKLIIAAMTLAVLLGVSFSVSAEERVVERTLTKSCLPGQVCEFSFNIGLKRPATKVVNRYHRAPPSEPSLYLHAGPAVGSWLNHDSVGYGGGILLEMQHRSSRVFVQALTMIGGYKAAEGLSLDMSLGAGYEFCFGLRLGARFNAGLDIDPDKQVESLRNRVIGGSALVGYRHKALLFNLTLGGGHRTYLIPDYRLYEGAFRGGLDISYSFGSFL